MARGLNEVVKEGHSPAKLGQPLVIVTAEGRCPGFGENQSPPSVVLLSGYRRAVGNVFSVSNHRVFGLRCTQSQAATLRSGAGNVTRLQKLMISEYIRSCRLIPPHRANPFDLPVRIQSPTNNMIGAVPVVEDKRDASLTR